MLKKLVILVLIISSVGFSSADESNDQQAQDKIFINLNENIQKLDELDAKKVEQELGIKLNESFITNMLSGNSKDQITKILNNNHMKEFPKEELRSMILLRTSGTKLNKWLEKNPKYLEMIIEVFKDDNALPSLVSIVNQPKKMKTYVFSCIIILIFGFLIKLKKDNAGIIKKIIFKFFVSVSSIALNIFVFCVIFKDELNPTFEIFQKYI